MGRKLRTALPRDTGFSLVELVVVVAVLSVLAVGASLVAVARDREPPDARVFARSFERARSAAVQSRQVQGLRLTPRGITRFAREAGAWVATGRERRWRGNVRVATDLPRQGGNGPNVLLLANGTVSGFTLNFNDRGRCLHDSFEGLICE